MAFEKAKVLKAAEKFLSQGKFNAAIQEYRRIVENDEDDLTTLNMLGDLYARAGQSDEAISCFSRIAEHYREQEFTLKAIAMYKKIERLKPRDPDIANKLAALYATQGLTADARAQYMIVADAYTRAGRTKETLDVLHKVADLDPNNTEIRLKLAEGYLKEGLRSEAAEVFIEAATRLYDTSQFEKALDSYSKALELLPHDESALKGAISAHVSLGTADEAAEILEQMVAHRPDELELISLLARTYIDAEDARGAERATSMLIAQDASNYARLTEVARLYLKGGEIDEATRVLVSIIEQLLAGGEENELLELVNEVLARNPDHVEALRLLVRIHWWQRDMEKLRSVLERLAEAAEAAALAEDERYALIQLIRLAPDEKRYSERLNELGGMPDDAGEQANIPWEPPSSEVPSFDHFSKTGEEVAGVPPPSGDAQGFEFEWNSVVDQMPADPSASFADLNVSLQESNDRFSSEANLLKSWTEGIESSGKGMGETLPPRLAAGQVDTDRSRREAMILQELESVDFYITQGYSDIAADTLELLERQFGLHPEIDLRREKLKAATAGEDTPVAVSSPEVFEFGATEHLPARDGEPAELSTNRNVAVLALDETGLEAQELSSLTGSTVAEEKGIDAGLAEIFEEFRVAAEEEPTTKEDYETHYNMGTAYKEMDLLDEAIHEFQTAAGLTKPADGTSRYLQCCNMLGHCFMQKGMARAAVLWFKKGLDSPGHSEDEYKALRYELGSAYEIMGDVKRALDLFTEVYGVDISYRGVAEKLRELQAQKPGSKGKNKSAS